MAVAVRDGKFAKYNDIAARGYAGQLTYGTATPWPQGQFVEYGSADPGRLLYGTFGGRQVRMDMAQPDNLRYGDGLF